jgi:multiple sugar transport system permease protein
MPALVVVLVMLGVPICYSVWLSFTNSSLATMAPARYVGFSEYRTVLDNPVFRQALGNTVVWVVGNVVPQILLGTGLALLINRQSRVMNVVRTLLVVPWVVPSVVTALVWMNMYDPFNGIVSSIFIHLGLQHNYAPWLGLPGTALGAVIAESVWKGTPFVMIVVLAGLQTISPDLYEAARVDGARYWQQLLRITVPMLRRTLALVTLLTVVFTVNNFNAIWIMTQGGPNYSTTTLYIWAYQLAFSDYNLGAAAALAVMMFVGLAVVGAVYFVVLDRGEFEGA